MADISKIKIPDGTSLNIKDATARQAIENLPKPMVFKGSLGTGGTITSLPAASSSNTGYVYKVIKAGTYASQSAKIGDTFVSDGSSWVLIPSGDEPSGTVTSIKINATSPINIDNSAAITTSGTRTISHASSGVSSGTYKSVTVNSTGHVTAGTNPTTIDGYGITDSAGRIVTGKEYTVDGETVVADTGAEVFNRYNGTYQNIAIGEYSHAEGQNTRALAVYSHAEGNTTVATGASSHAEGGGSRANGGASHAEGLWTIASSDYQHAQGKYNIEDLNNTYSFIIGNGSNIDNRSNAFAIDWRGKIYVNNSGVGTDVNKLEQKVLNESGKNKLKIGFNSITNSGITITYQDDGSLVLNGTNPSSSARVVCFDLATGNTISSTEGRQTLPAGRYFLKGTGSTSVRVQLYGHDGSDVGGISNTGQDATITIDDTWPYHVMRIWVAGSASFDNLKIYPMLCTEEDYGISYEFVPYAENNYQLTKNKTSKEDVVDINSGLGTLIPNNTDWDTLTDIGNYYVAASSNMATMTNAPTTGSGGRLEVTTANAVAHRIQRFYVSSATNQRFYMRMLILQSGNLVWTDWTVYYGTFASDDTWITLKSGSGTGISASDVKYRLNGKTMCITGYVTPSSSAASVTIGTLAAKYRPISLQTDHVSQASGIAETTFSAQVLTDGTVKFQGNSASAITANIQYYFTLTYIVAN